MRVFLIAGEPSGDLLGGALMAGLKQLFTDVQFDGVGGPAMEAQGLVSRFEMSELTVMGIAEVLPKYRHLKRRIAETAAAVLETRPDVLITIDSPDFCLRVARIVKADSAVRTVHYVAPSVWAWRPKRAEKMAHSIDHVLALLPFEPPYMQAAGMDCDFVGHPVVAQPVASDEEVRAFRATHGLEAADPLLLVLPGSRRGEVARIGPIFGAAIETLARARPNARLVSVVAPNVAEQVQELTSSWPVQPILVDGGNRSAKRAALRAADLALAASGTVAVELARSGTPMVIGYKMNWLSFQIIKAMAITRRVNLVNIVTDSDHVPERLGPDCQPESLARDMEAVLAAPAAQKQAMTETMRALGLGGEDPGLRAARAVLKGLQPD